MLRGLATKPVHDDLLQSRLSQKDRLWSGKPARKYVELPHGLFDRPCSSLRRDSGGRSEEHTSELQSLMRISYAVFCLKKNSTKNISNIEVVCKIQQVIKHEH